MDTNLLKPLTRWCEINLDLLSENIDKAKKLISPDTKIMAVIKDNAYGHGDVVIAKEMESLGIDFFAVSHIDEAIRLRKNGIKSDILILSYTSAYYFELLSKYELTQTLISLEYAKKLDNFCNINKCKINTHVNIDTGMHRLGLCYDGTPSTLEPILKIYNMPNLNITGTYTHYPVADSLSPYDIAYTQKQYNLFQDLISILKKKGIHTGILHSQNTPCALHFPNFKCDYIRVGSLLLGMIYGDIAMSPYAKNFKSILSLKSKISIVKTLPPNSKVSYGLNYTTSKLEKIAVVAIGYGDGFSRYLSNRDVHIIVNGHLAKIIGNICIDQLIINVTSIPNIKEGDIVTLIGSDNNYTISVDDIAKMMNTLNNEITNNINPRVPRVYIRKNDAFIKFLLF